MLVDNPVVIIQLEVLLDSCHLLIDTVQVVHLLDHLQKLQVLQEVLHLEELVVFERLVYQNLQALYQLLEILSLIHI